MNFTESEQMNIEESTTLHISYLPFDTIEDDLMYLFKQFTVQNVQIIK